MDFARPICLGGQPLAGGRLPAVCVPLVGADETALQRELAHALAVAPNLIEWRVDHFGAIADQACVLAAAHNLRAQAGNVPLLLTCRSVREGGRPTTLDTDQVLALYAAVARAGHVDALDWEFRHGALFFAQAVQLARETQTLLIASWHDFQTTPGKEALVEAFAAMQRAGADVAKVAVMPRDVRDVLTLLQATLDARRTLHIPVVGLSMGALGAVSRLCGWMYGSALTFAAVDQASAPGQLPAAELQPALELLQRPFSVATQTDGGPASAHQ